MSDAQHTHFLQSVARIRQIEDGVTQTDKQERATRRTLKKSGQATEVNLLKLKSEFLQAKLELYNEVVKIESSLLNERTKPFKTADKKEIVRLAKQLDLSTSLQKQRVLLMRRGPGRRATCFCSDNCTLFCSACVTCVECVTGSCMAVNMPIGG